MKLQRLGGYAAIASVFGVAAYVVPVIMGINIDLSDPAKFMAMVSAAPVSFYALCILQIVRFTLWQIMFFALYERVQNKMPQLARTSLIAASAGTAILIAVAILYFNTIRIILQHRILMQDAAAYRVIDAIAGGLVITTAHIYGWAFLLMGCAILRARLFSHSGLVVRCNRSLWLAGLHLSAIGVRLPSDDLCGFGLGWNSAASAKTAPMRIGGNGGFEMSRFPAKPGMSFASSYAGLNTL